jgi:hypothetical protein
VSSTRPAPRSGDESSAARSARAPNPFVRAASSTVRSTSRRSRSRSISRAYQDAGRAAEAIALFERALADRERVLGPDHPGTVESRDNLAAARAAQR